MSIARFLNHNHKVLGLFVLSVCLHSCNCSKDYYDNGQLWTEYCRDSDGRKSGPYSEYYDTGKLFASAGYVRDSLDGDFILYHRDETVFMKMRYRMNRLLEVVEFRDSHGGTLDAGSFQNGNGVLNLYYESGNLRSFGPMVNGVKHGPWFINSRKGVIDTVQFVNGYREGRGRFETVP